MLGFLAIFGAAMAGYAGSQPWVIAGAAIALMSLSYAEHYALYRQAQERGEAELLQSVTLGSAFNALAATSLAYGCGLFLRLAAIVS